MSEETFREFEEALAAAGKDRYFFRLYVTGATPRSRRAICNLREICDRHLPGRYDLEVIDVYQQPARAGSDRIVATPTLVKSLPLPLRQLVGDLSDRERVLLRLDLRPEPVEAA